MQENALGLKASEAAYGESSRGSFAFYDLDTCSWRTWQRCLDGELSEWLETWPNAGMTRNGIAFPLRPSVPFISGIGSFFWPTARVSMANGPSKKEIQDGDPKKRLETAVACREMLPAPSSCKAANDVTLRASGDGRKKPNKLGWAVSESLVPTPKDMQAYAMLTTPSADDTGHRKKPYSQGGEALSFQIGGQLNPTWVEWLMGFPLGWTDLEA